MSTKSKASQKRTSEVQQSKDASKKQKHDMDNPNAVEAEKNIKKKLMTGLTKENDSSAEAILESKISRLSESSAQGYIESYPIAEKHSADISNASVKIETIGKKYSATVNIPPSDMIHYIKQKGRDSSKVKDHIQSICLEVKEQFFTENGKVWVGYESNKKDVPVFVAEVEKRNHKAPEKFYGCRLYQRVEEETTVPLAEDSDGKKSKGKVNFTGKEIINLCDCMERNTDRMLKSHSNILAIMGSDKILHENQNKIEDTTCVVIYVRIKGIIPFYEEPFELDNNDFPLDIREGRGVTLVSRLSPKEYSKSVRMGCKIESAYGSGTLTGFLQLPNRKIGCLTAWHLFDTGKGEHTAELLKSDNFNKNVYQPDKQLEEENRLGKVIRVSEEFDAALIEIDEPDRLPRNGNFPNAVCRREGYPLSNPMKFETGDIISRREELYQKMSCTVVKYGAVTETTFGNIGNLGEQFTLTLQNGRKCNLRKPIFVCPKFGNMFCDKGDSGALVFLQDEEIDNKRQEDDENDDDMKEDDKNDDKKKELRAIGMLVSKIDRNGDYLTVVMPIWEILHSFNLPLRLLSFEEPWNIGFDQLQEQLKEVNANLNTVGQQLAQNTEIMRETYEAVRKFIHQNTNLKR